MIMCVLERGSGGFCIWHVWVAVLQFLEILEGADLEFFWILVHASENLRLFSLFVRFDRCVNVFESRLVGLCEKFCVRFHCGRCGTLSPICPCSSACMSKILRSFSLFWKFGGE